MQRQLWQKQEAKDEAEKEIASLTREERKAHTKLSSLEDSIQELEEEKRALQAEFENLQGTQKELQARISDLGKREAVIRTEIQDLLPRLWEVVLRAEVLKAKVFDSWPEADRSMVWLARLTDTASSKMQDLHRVQTDVREKERSLQAAKTNLEDKRKELSKLSKELTGKRLRFLEQVQVLRKKRQAAEKDLRALQARIQELQSELASKDRQAFSLHKGRLPWPAQGRVIVDYEPQKGRSNRGLGFSLPPDEEIKAVSWGEVVYNDKLRGFGQVIIIYHGHEYYSLYAFLSQSLVQKGQEVEQGAVIGRAGFYPQAQGPGMYFELRRKQAPVDPRSWLAKR
ncbi:MAG: peptidoglycan DD-metalloendopeptidase family protein [Desulfovermiculus sp.]|nr:peptidoglycan DD-metalloendopeptidase family protein [Desulfovermiculus sp.]